MISKQTARDINTVLAAWQLAHNVSSAAVDDLFVRLATVRGNQSFTDSVRALARVTKEGG